MCAYDANNLNEEDFNFYKKLVDDESRQLYLWRYKSFIEQNQSLCVNLVKIAEEYQKKRMVGSKTKILESTPREELFMKRAVLYGAGEDSPQVASMAYRYGLVIDAVLDSAKHKHGTSFLNSVIPIKPPEYIKTLPDDELVIISSSKYQKEIYSSLKKMNISDEQIYIPYTTINMNYYNRSFLKPVPNEICLDVGTWDSTTLREFISFCNENYKEIIAFEADPLRQETILSEVQEYAIERTRLIAKGASNMEGFLYFEGMGSMLTKVDEPTDKSVSLEVTTIDTIAQNLPVTMIKMDIEGSELDALEGAKEVISRNKPRLLISIYHKLDDIITIPRFLSNLVPEYRFYLRHNSYCVYETVLYAVLN